MELGDQSAVPAEAGFLVDSSGAVLVAANPIQGGRQWLQPRALEHCTMDIASPVAGGRSGAMPVPGPGFGRLAMPGRGGGWL